MSFYHNIRKKESAFLRILNKSEKRFRALRKKSIVIVGADALGGPAVKSPNDEGPRRIRNKVRFRRELFALF